MEVEEYVLIETYWNVNSLSKGDVQDTGKGINRNILECKFCSKIGSRFSLFCINRNILECKCILVARRWNLCCVLIETYWNVNTKEFYNLSNLHNVLIETYWNVNRLEKCNIKIK